MTTRFGAALVTLALAAAWPVRATGPLFDEYGDDGAAVEPSGPAPTALPPPPPQAPPPAAAAPVQPLPAPRPAGTGQWVFTEQYGWVWMPYGANYTYVPADGGTPSMYVYYPEAGWCWVVAPWLWGLGPRPYFGVAGPGPFVWFGIGLGHWYGFHSAYRHWGWGDRGYYHGGGWRGVGRVYGGRGGYVPWPGGPVRGNPGGRWQAPRR